MNPPETACLLKILIGESDRWQHEPLYEAIVMKAKEMGLAGATVLRSPLGFGAGSQVHSAKILQLSSDLPVLIEMVDTEEKLNLFLPQLDSMMKGGLVTIQELKVLRRGPRESS